MVSCDVFWIYFVHKETFLIFFGRALIRVTKEKIWFTESVQIIYLEFLSDFFYTWIPSSFFHSLYESLQLLCLEYNYLLGSFSRHLCHQCTQNFGCLLLILTRAPDRVSSLMPSPFYTHALILSSSPSTIAKFTSPPRLIVFTTLYFSPNTLLSIS